MRREFSRAVRLAAWQRSGGFCEGTNNGKRCGLKLHVGKFAYDHDIPDGLGGEPTLENCRVLCAGPGSCHEVKTATEDTPRVAKMKRQRDKFILGVRKGRSSLSHPRLRKKMSGEVVAR